MNKLYVILFFVICFQSLGQQQEYFKFTDTTFKVNSIKRVSYIYSDCIADSSGSYQNEYDKKNLDSITIFLINHNSIVLELGVHYSTVKRDREDADYFKSLLLHRGIDASRISISGYGSKYPIYPKKTVNEIRRKVRKGLKKGENSKEWYGVLEQINNENNRIELKILQQ